MFHIAHCQIVGTNEQGGYLYHNKPSFICLQTEHGDKGENEDKTGRDGGGGRGGENFVAVALEVGDLVGLELENLLLNLRDKGTGGECGPTETTDPVVGDGAEPEASSTVLSVVETMERHTIIRSETLNRTSEVRVGERTENTLGLTASLELTAKEEISSRISTEPVTSNVGTRERSKAEGVLRAGRERSREARLGPRMGTAFTITKEVLTTETRVIVQKGDIEGTIHAVTIIKRITSHVPVTSGTDTNNVSRDPTGLGEDTVDSVTAVASVQDTA